MTDTRLKHGSAAMKMTIDELRALISAVDFHGDDAPKEIAESLASARVKLRAALDAAEASDS